MVPVHLTAKASNVYGLPAHLITFTCCPRLYGMPVHLTAKVSDFYGVPAHLKTFTRCPRLYGMPAHLTPQTPRDAGSFIITFTTHDAVVCGTF